ncbi:endonuclease domain-containing protein [Microbacterium sp. P5_E9]
MPRPELDLHTDPSTEASTDIERLCSLVRDNGGVVTVAKIVDAGHSRWVLHKALEIGALKRVRRGWVALQAADRFLVAAAHRGVVLTCVTQAKRLGLWVLADDDRHHVGADPRSSRVTTATKVVVHWSRPLIARAPGQLVDPIENVLAAVAACQPYERALAIWESALRQQLVSKEGLAALPLGPAARRILREAEIYSDSGLETMVVPRLRWMGLPLRRQVWIAGHRVDLLIGERLVLQIDGAHHVGAQRTADIDHDAQLMLLGYHVIRVGYQAVVHGWPHVQEQIMRAVAQGLHRAPKEQ